MGIPDHLTCLLWNLYAGQEATVRIGHGTADWFKIRKGVHQGCISSPCLFNLYAEYIVRNVRLDESEAGIRIARRNINNLRLADDINIMVKSEEELKSPLMKVKEESWKGWLKTQHSKKSKGHDSWSHHVMVKRWEKKWKPWQTLFSSAPKSVQPWNKSTCSLEEKLWQT